MKKFCLLLLTFLVLVVLASCTPEDGKNDFLTSESTPEAVFEAIFQDMQTTVGRIRFSRNDVVSSKPYTVKAAVRKYYPPEGNTAKVGLTITLSAHHGDTSGCTMSGKASYMYVYNDLDDRSYSFFQLTIDVDLTLDDVTIPLKATINATTDNVTGEVLSYSAEGTLDGVSFQTATE